MKIFKSLFLSLLVCAVLLTAVPVNETYASETQQNSVLMGIDISTWNDVTDWAAVAEQVDFAILRIGSKGSLDQSFMSHASGCEGNKIPFGVYYVISALTTEAALAEANLVIDALNGHTLSFPVFLDVEHSLQGSLSSLQLQAVVTTFCNAIADAGYEPGLYSYVEILEAHFMGDDFAYLPKWVSQIDVDQCTYSGEYVMWQYSWSERLSGISGDVDCNYYYAEFSGRPCEHTEASYSFENGTHFLTCSSCGNTVTKIAVDGKKLGFNTAAPTLSDDIVMKIGTTVPEGFTEPYMVVEFNGVTSVLTDYTINAINGRYEFAFSGINPQIMGDTFHATLHATVGSFQVNVTLDYSMLKYINSQLKKDISAQLRTALSDLVMYGEYNQVYEGYKTDALLSTLLDETAVLTPSTFQSLDESLNKQATSGSKDANIDLKGVTMALGSKLRVQLTVFCTDPSVYSVKINLNGVDVIVPVSDLPLADGYTDRYILEFDQVRATQFGEAITFSFLDADGSAVGRILNYSVYSYIQKNQNSADANLANLLQAIYNYGESVKKI